MAQSEGEGLVKEPLPVYLQYLQSTFLTESQGTLYNVK